MNPDTDRWVRSEQMRTRQRALLDEVEHGGAHIYVLSYDRPRIVMVPVEWYERAREALGEGPQ